MLKKMLYAIATRTTPVVEPVETTTSQPRPPLVELVETE